MAHDKARRGQYFDAAAKTHTGDLARKVLPLVRETIRPWRWNLCYLTVLMMLGRIAALALPGSIRYLLDSVVQSRSLKLLPWYVFWVVGAISIQALTGYLTEGGFVRVSCGLLLNLRSRVYQHTLHLPLSFFDRRRVGAVVARILTDLEPAGNIAGPGVVSTLGTVITILFALIGLASISWGATLISLISLTLVIVGTRQRLLRTRPLFAKRTSQMNTVSAAAFESTSGIRTVKSYAVEGRCLAVFVGGLERVVNETINIARCSASANLVFGTLGGLCFLSLMCFSAVEVVHGNLSVGSLVTTVMFYGLLVGPASQLVGVGTQVLEALHAFERAQEVLLESPENHDQRVKDLGPVFRMISFENVTFEYDCGKPALHGVSFQLASGTLTAIVGPSGAGKTTLLNLIAGFYNPTGGRISVSGSDLSTVDLRSYRRMLGLVSQDTFLFDGSIRENVALARPSADVTAITEACIRAGVLAFADRLPNGLDTQIGERGTRVSGGERQRIAVARALLAEPAILLLDEPTSGLDRESSEAVEMTIVNACGGRTTVMVTHRLESVKHADQVIVLEKGRVVECGTEYELRKMRGCYWRLLGEQGGCSSSPSPSSDSTASSPTPSPSAPPKSASARR